MSIEQMRAKVSVLYKGDWADRVAKMSDAQVYSIYQRHLNKERQKEKI
jgi:hypothetical protein